MLQRCAGERREDRWDSGSANKEGEAPHMGRAGSGVCRHKGKDGCSEPLSKLSLKGMLKPADVHSVVSTHVETVVLLRGVKTDSHISVDLDVEKLGLKTVK